MPLTPAFQKLLGNPSGWVLKFVLQLWFRCFASSAYWRAWARFAGQHTSLMFLGSQELDCPCIEDWVPAACDRPNIRRSAGWYPPHLPAGPAVSFSNPLEAQHVDRCRLILFCLDNVFKEIHSRLPHLYDHKLWLVMPSARRLCALWRSPRFIYLETDLIVRTLNTGYLMIRFVGTPAMRRDVRPWRQVRMAWHGYMPVSVPSLAHSASDLPRTSWRGGIYVCRCEPGGQGRIVRPMAEMQGNPTRVF